MYKKVCIGLCCFFITIIIIKIVGINREIKKQENVRTEVAMYEKNEDGYRMIAQDYAKAVMEKNKNITILDVRTEEEYSIGHIENAIVIPHNRITEKNREEVEAKLGNYKTVIFVYSRRGKESEEIAGKLAELGYENVFEFGGIEDWKYGLSR